LHFPHLRADANFQPAGGIGRAAGHGAAIEGVCDLAVVSHNDKPTRSLGQNLEDDLISRLFGAHPLVFHEGRDGMAGDASDELLAGACAGDGTGLVVGVGAAAADRRIADAAGQYRATAARRSRSGDVSFLIKADAADRAVILLVEIVVEAALLPFGG